MMRSTRSSTSRALPLLLGLTALGLAGCSEGAKQTFGLDITPPNAFDVGTEAPLAIPPDLGQLPLPEPGQPRPQQVSASQQAEDILSPQTALASPDTTMGPGQQALLAEAGSPPPPDIRATVNQQAHLETRSPGFVSSLMFWNHGNQSPVVNAPAESRRIEENAALAQPVTKGVTPQETPANPGIFSRILNFF